MSTWVALVWFSPDAQLLQQAAKVGQQQQLLGQHSDSLQRHASRLLKRVGHDAAGQQVGEALLLLAGAAAAAAGPSPMETSTGSASNLTAQALVLVTAVGTKYLLRFGSRDMVQAAVDAQLVTASDALQQACRRDPGNFLQLLDSSLDKHPKAVADQVGGPSMSARGQRVGGWAQRCKDVTQLFELYTAYLPRHVFSIPVAATQPS